MRTILLFVCFIYGVCARAQTDTIYFNNNWQLCKKADAAYYRVIHARDHGVYRIDDHYLNGIVQMTGYLTAKDTLKSSKTGNYVFYDSTGKKEAEIKFINGRANGVAKFYFLHDTALRSQVTLVNDSLNGPAVYYDSATHKKVREGNLWNGEYDGRWKFYLLDDSTIVIEQVFDKGKWIGGMDYDL